MRRGRYLFCIPRLADIYIRSRSMRGATSFSGRLAGSPKSAVKAPLALTSPIVVPAYPGLAAEDEATRGRPDANAMAAQAMRKSAVRNFKLLFFRLFSISFLLFNLNFS